MNCFQLCINFTTNVLNQAFICPSNVRINNRHFIGVNNLNIFSCDVKLIEMCKCEDMPFTIKFQEKSGPPLEYRRAIKIKEEQMLHMEG
jgi:hypothetical protein